ncbi:MAG: glucose 1-dehydrogenase [Chloroflexi bacterium]|nr:glucose 1-dehydrogenase [Chloroflexota bacterium]
MRLEGKVAIVTGGGSGIGRAICLRFAQEGANVAVADINLAGAEETVALAAAAPGEAWAAACDITRLDAVRTMAAAVLARWGRIDVLVNNAGWDKIELFSRSQPETWNKVIDINLRGPVNCVSAVLPAMTDQGSGSIISIGSDAGRVGSSGEAVYSACKAGVIGFSKTIAREMARHNVRVNVVCPGPTNTPLLDEITGGDTGSKIIEGMVRQVPFRRLGQPEDITGAVVFFASDDSGYVTGQVLSVSGGLTMAG